MTDTPAIPGLDDTVRDIARKLIIEGDADVHRVTAKHLRALARNTQSSRYRLHLELNAALYEKCAQLCDRYQAEKRQ